MKKKKEEKKHALIKNRSGDEVQLFLGAEKIFRLGQDNCGVVLSANNKASLSTPLPAPLWGWFKIPS